MQTTLGGDFVIFMLEGDRRYWYDTGQEDTATWCYCEKTLQEQQGNLECCPLVVLSEARGLDFILSVQFVPLAHDIVFKTSAFD